MAKYSAEEMAQLTEDEREGLAELEAEERAEAGDDGVDPAAGADADADAEKDPAAPDPAPSAEADKGASPPPAVDKGGTPFPTYEMPADYDTRLSTLETQRAAVAQQFDDGDLTGAELNAKLAALTREEQELREQKLRAEISYDARLEGWKMSATAFIQANPQYSPGSPLFRMLDEEVKTLQNAAANPFDPKILIEAEAKVKTQLAEIAKLTGMASPAKTQAPAAGTAPTGEKPAIPPSLAAIPAAALEDTGTGSEFAHLDRLMQTNYPKYEEALAKLTEEQRERYEMGG